MIYILISHTYKYLPVTYITFLFISTISPIFSIPKSHNNILLQDTNILQRDSLREISFLNIEELLYNAKETQDTARIISFYNKFVEKSSDREKLFYLDSILSYSKPFKDTNSTYNAYFDQALLYLKTYSYKKSLNAILNAYALARDEDNKNQQISALLLLAHVNTLWNNSTVSLEIYSKINSLKSKTDKIEDENLNIIIALGTSSVLLQNKNPDSALVYVNNFKINEEPSNSLFYDSYLWNSGMAYFQKNEYKRGLDSMHKASSVGLSNYYNTLVYFYEAKYNATLGNEKQAMDYYLKMDTLITKYKLVFPETKEVYTEINDYYLKNGDYSNQFLYLNKLINAINTQADVSTYIAKTTRDLYEMPEILIAKQAQIEKLRNSEFKIKLATLIIGSIFLIILIILFFYIHKQRNYKKRFTKLMSEKIEDNTKSKEENQNSAISLEVINDLMQKLETFEINKDFTNRDISLNEVSKQFNTNSSYLSKVINLKKDKNFSNYINDLRIEYCIELLNSNEKLRKYTIKALAEEVGFNNPQSFSNAFFKYAGIYPSFFIGELNKIKK